jgi:hypothetical protein
VYQPGQIGLPGRTQLVRGASALLTGLVLPERPGYVGVNLSRQGSVCRTPCSFRSANSSRWDLGNSSTQGLGRSQTQDSIGFMPPSQHGMFGSSLQQNMCSINVSSADSVMPTVGPHTLGVLTNPTAGQAETAAAHAAVGSSNWQPFSPTMRLSRTHTMDNTATTVSAWQHAVGSPRSGHASTTAAAAAAVHQGPLLMIGPNGGGCAVCGS